MSLWKTVPVDSTTEMSLTPTPAKSPLEPFWRVPHRLDGHRSTQELPATADVVIIGGGFAGASIAHHLLLKSDESARVQPSVVILEAREACSGATGRNGLDLLAMLFIEAGLT
jgi:hypothetical protein